MKLSATVLAGLAGYVVAMEQAQGKMEQMMAIKMAQRETQRSNGVFGGRGMYGRYNSHQPCVDGKSGEYSCDNVDMVMATGRNAYAEI